MGVSAILAKGLFAGGDARLLIWILVAGAIGLIDLFAVFMAFRRGTLFKNIIKSGVLFGLPMLLAGGCVLMGLMGSGSSSSGANSSSSSSGWTSEDYEGGSEYRRAST